MAGVRYADILEYLVVNLPEQIDVEIVRFKDIAILREPNRFEPLADVAHVASCSSSDFASLQIARVKALGEPGIHRSQQIARLLHLALVAPETGEAHGGAEFPGFGLLLTGD